MWWDKDIYDKLTIVLVVVVVAAILAGTSLTVLKVVSYTPRSITAEPSGIVTRHYTAHGFFIMEMIIKNHIYLCRDDGGTIIHAQHCPCLNHESDKELE